MASAAFTSIVAQASLSLINNQGNLGAALKDLGSSSALKSLAVSVASAGVAEGINQYANIETGTSASFGDRLAYQGIKGATGTVVNTTVGGQDFDQALQSAALSATSAMDRRLYSRASAIWPKT